MNNSRIFLETAESLVLQDRLLTGEHPLSFASQTKERQVSFKISQRKVHLFAKSKVNYLHMKFLFYVFNE